MVISVTSPPIPKSVSQHDRQCFWQEEEGRKRRQQGTAGSLVQSPLSSYTTGGTQHGPGPFSGLVSCLIKLGQTQAGSPAVWEHSPALNSNRVLRHLEQRSSGDVQAPERLEPLNHALFKAETQPAGADRPSRGRKRNCWTQEQKCPWPGRRAAVLSATDRRTGPSLGAASKKWGHLFR